MKGVFHVAEKDAAQEREDVAIALTEQQVSSTTPKRVVETQAPPVQDQCPRKAMQAETLGEEGKISTYWLYISKAWGRASWDHTKQELPGCGDHLQGIPLENTEKRHGRSRPSTVSLSGLGPCLQK